PEADHRLDDEEDDGGRDGAVEDRRGNAIDLRGDARAFGRFGVDHGRGEDAGQDRADQAADTVDAEDVEAVVVAERLLDVDRGEVAADTGDDADGKRAARR